MIKTGGIMRKIFTLLMVLCLVFSFSVFAFADNKDWHRKKDGMESKICKKIHMAMKYGEELGLTDEQQDQIKDLNIKLKKDMIQYNAKIDIVKIDIKSKLWNNKIDQVQVDKYINEKYDIKKAKAKVLISYLIDFKSIFSEDQMKQLKGYCMKEMK